MRIFSLILMSAAAALAGQEQEVDAVFAAHSGPDSPGCAVGVLQNGRTALAKGYGLADLEHRIPLTPTSRFYMASVSKQFTAMSLLLAEREGKLKLDDSVRKYLPELPPYTDAVTIRRMLDHTAGLRDYLSLWVLRGFSNESVLREDPSLALIARQKSLDFEPGTEYSYSNSGYLLAAIALKRATGQSLDAWARERIFNPLEMRASRFQADHGDPVPNRAHGYQHRDGSWKTTDVGFDVIGSGGLYSNIEDMLRWGRNFEQPVVGQGQLIALQTAGKMLDGRPNPSGYALGLIAKDGTYSHSGAALGYSTFFLRVPKHAVTVVCLCNQGGAPVARLAARVAAIYTGEPAPADPVPAESKQATLRAWKPGEAGRLAGSYWSDELQTVWELRERNGKLWLHGDGATEEVRPGPDDLYRVNSAQIRTADNGLRVSSGRARGIVFTRR